MYEVLLKFEKEDKFLEFMAIFEDEKVSKEVEVDSINNIIIINKTEEVNEESSD